MKWIKIEDRKPNNLDRVICKSPDVWHPFCAQYSGNGFFDALVQHVEAISDYDYSDAELRRCYDGFKITHWMPMPEPPKTK